MLRSVRGNIAIFFGAIGLAAAAALLAMFVAGPVLGDADDEPFVRHGNGPARELREKLARPMTLERGIGPSTTLNDVLDLLSDRHGVTFVVDSNAFAAIGVQKPEESPVSLPPIHNAPLGSVLRLLLGQVKGDQYVGTFQIKDGHIEITTTYHQFMSQAVMAEFGRPNVPDVTIEARGQNLEEAIACLADTTGINVILDGRVRDRARRVAAPALHDVPLDTALRLMADMAGLAVTITDKNVFYVTDVENARVLRAEHEKWLSKFRPPLKPI